MDPFNPYHVGGNSFGDYAEGFGAKELAPHIQQQILFQAGVVTRDPERIAREIGQEGVDADDVAAFMRQNGVEPEYAQGSSGHSGAAASGSSSGREPLTGHVQQQVDAYVAAGHRNPQLIAQMIGQGVNPNHVDAFMRRNGVEPDYSQGSSSSHGAGVSSGRAAAEVESQPAADQRSGLSINIPAGPGAAAEGNKRPLAGWRIDGKALISPIPGNTRYPRALAPKDTREYSDHVALGRFLTDTKAEKVPQKEIVEALGLNDRYAIKRLRNSLPDALQPPKNIRREAAQMGAGQSGPGAAVEGNEDPLAGWRADRDALISPIPGNTRHPRALAPKDTREYSDHVALSRFLTDTKNVPKQKLANAIGRNAPAIGDLRRSLPKNLRPPAMSRQEAARIAGRKRAEQRSAARVEAQPSPDDPGERNWGPEVAGWRIDGDALLSPGHTEYPKALAPTNTRERSDHVALSRFLTDIGTENVSHTVAANAIGRKTGTAIGDLRRSLPEDLRPPAKTRQEAAQMGNRQKQLLRTQSLKSTESSGQPAPAAPQQVLLPPHLAPHEQNILTLHAAGNSSAQIAGRLRSAGVSVTADDVLAVIRADALRRAQNPQQG